MNTRDPNILLEKAGIPMIPPGKVLAHDLDDPAVWTRPPLKPESSATGHHGGGPNIAGEPIEEPTMTFRQKLAVQFGRVKGVLRVWESWHMNGPAKMSAIAYCTGVDAIFGRLYRLRGHRYNGGQWHSIIFETHAYVLIMGVGQYATRMAWRAVGFLWFSMGAPEMKGHRDWNDDPRTEGPTSCPGDENHRKIHSGEYLKALGKLRFKSKRRFSRGKRVLLFTTRMVELGFMDAPVKKYRRPEMLMVKSYQASRGLEPDGIVGPVTWRDAALLDR